MTRFVIFGSILVVAACFGIAFAGPIGQRDEATTAATEATVATVGSNNELSTTAMAVVDTLNTGDEAAVIDETGIEVAGGNETHIRQKRSCGCCCCRPCCCCCRPCCCCCRCCCQCCCRCCCCCCRPCCCCCRPCCCCCRPCCCGGCGCCGCGGGRKRRSIQVLTHKLMDKQAALLRAESESAEIIASTTTVAPEVPTTTAIYTNANIDGFGRSYSNLAFADFNQAPTETIENDFYFRQLI